MSKLNILPQKAHPWPKTRLLSAHWWRFIRRCDL